MSATAFQQRKRHTSETASPLCPNLRQKQRASFLPVSFLLGESPVRVFRGIENVLGVVERDDEGGFSVSSGARYNGGRPAHGNVKEGREEKRGDFILQEARSDSLKAKLKNPSDSDDRKEGLNRKRAKLDRSPNREIGTSPARRHSPLLYSRPGEIRSRRMHVKRPGMHSAHG
jgi:hypothetical protein